MPLVENVQNPTRAQKDSSMRRIFEPFLHIWDDEFFFEFRIARFGRNLAPIRAIYTGNAKIYFNSY